MKRGQSIGARAEPDTASRVGLFGLLGSGNIGNDGSLEVILAYLASERPDAVIDFMCAGPELVRSKYDVEATPLNWFQQFEARSSGPAAFALKVVGKGLDLFRTVSWVRRHDVVIVPGMGALEATLPLHPWGFPYALFLLCASGRAFGTKVALVDVGADLIRQRATRRLFVAAARLAHYRSYRDDLSRDAARQMGVDTSQDDVYPDLVFALPTSKYVSAGSRTVGLGVMAYYGGNDDRSDADEIHAAYVGKLNQFARWLVDNGWGIRLLTGDDVDEEVVRDVMADLRKTRPELDPSRIVAEPVKDLHQLMTQISAVDVVVATRYHNVLCALKLLRPTVSLGYAAKNDVLMAQMGLPDYCQHAQTFDVDLLVEQVHRLEYTSKDVREILEVNRARVAARLEEQFSALSASLFSDCVPLPSADEPPGRGSEPSGSGVRGSDQARLGSTPLDRLANATTDIRSSD